MQIFISMRVSDARRAARRSSRATVRGPSTRNGPGPHQQGGQLRAHAPDGAKVIAERPAGAKRMRLGELLVEPREVGYRHVNLRLSSALMRSTDLN